MNAIQKACQHPEIIEDLNFSSLPSAEEKIKDIPELVCTHSNLKTFYLLAIALPPKLVSASSHPQHSAKATQSYFRRC